jgi:transcriptional regulator with XRE-family HTH domain
MLLDKDRRDLVRQALREARLRSNLRQADVAASLGKPQSYVAKVERGERRIDLVEFLNLCKVLKLNPQRLISKLL